MNYSQLCNQDLSQAMAATKRARAALLDYQIFLTSDVDSPQGVELNVLIESTKLTIEHLQSELNELKDEQDRRANDF